MSLRTKKICFVLFLLLLDVILFPLIIQIPYYIKDYGFQFLEAWLNDLSLFTALKDTFLDGTKLKIFLIMQLIPVYLLILAFWKDIPRKKYRVKDGVGGPESAGSGQYGSSRWLTEKEMDRHSTVWKFEERTQKGGMILGVDLKRCSAWVDTQDVHSITVGATRSGKSRRLVLPSIWQLAHAGESMILTDPKGELYEKSAAWLKKMGYEIVLLDFRKPGRGNHWNPMHIVNVCIDQENIAKATQHAWSIANMFVYSQEGSTRSEPIWNNGAESVIAGLILAIAMDAKNHQEARHLTSVYRTLAALGQPTIAFDREIVPLNEYINQLPIGHPAKDAFAAAMLAPDRTRGSFFATCAALLRLFSDPSIAFLTSAQDHDLTLVGKKKTAVFLVIPDEDKTRHSLAALYIDQTYQQLVELANQNGGRLPIRVNMILDEFGNMPRIKDFDAKLTVSGGRGIRWNLILQDFQQLHAIYKEHTHTIKGNCHNLLYLLTTDTKTAEEISKRCGRYTIEAPSSGANVKSFGIDVNRSVNSSLMGRDLLTPDEVMRWPGDQVLFLSARSFPARLPLPDLSQLPCDKVFVSTPDDGIRHVAEVKTFIPGIGTLGGDEERKEIAADRNNEQTKPAEEKKKTSKLIEMMKEDELI